MTQAHTLRMARKKPEVWLLGIHPACTTMPPGRDLVTELTASCSEAQEEKVAYNKLAEQQHEVEEGDTDF